MSFMFQCPNGHVLEGDPASAGQQCQCPTCGILFIIPAPVAPSSPSGQNAPPWANQMSAAPSFPTPPFQAPSFNPGQPFPPSPGQIPAFPAAGPVPFSSPPPEEERLYHIPCPNGHELETPSDMLDQDVLCPHCNVQFRLREKDSVEFKRARQEEMARRERKLGKAWLNWAITIAVLVVLLLLLLILFG